MRHVNHIIYHGYFGKHVMLHPYQTEYKFNRPSRDRKYIKVLEFIADHPLCSRREIIKHVWGIVTSPGSMSNLFSNMLYHDIIDYDKHFKYTITSAGRKLLKQTYLIAMEDYVKAK